MTKAELMKDADAIKETVESYEYELKWAEWFLADAPADVARQANVRRWQKRLARANKRLDAAYVALGRWVYANE